MKELVYPRLLLPAVETMADRESVVCGDHRATLGEHTDRALRLATALGKELGVGAEDRFAVMAINSHRYMELWHAAFLGGGVINPLNLRLAAPELAYILADSGTEVVFTDGMFAPLVQAAIAASEHELAVRQIVTMGDIGDLQIDGAIDYEELLAGSSPDVPAEPDEDSIVVLMYTGGTTGLPKGVLHDQRAQILNTYHAAFYIDFDEDMVWLHQTPMFHAASTSGILSLPPTGGKSIVMPMFDPGAVPDLIAAEGVTGTVMVPTMVGMMLGTDNYSPEKLASMELLVYGASPMPPATLEKLMTDMPNLGFINGYGMTEAASTATFLLPEDHVLGSPRLRAAGRPVYGTSISIRDDEGEQVAQGETGEVWLRSGALMREYWNKPEATAEVFEGGWYHTGDAGYVDEDGYLFLVDRVKDMIVTGGENVYSVEVEAAMGTHPDVAQVAVIGIPHDVWVEAVHAIVVPMPGVEPDEESILEHTRAQIAGYKVPKTMEFRAEPLPLSGAMKVLKRELRAPFWEGRDSGVS
ncbi:MAG: AMP-binding protein [Actinomycetota bacterium]